MLFHAFPRMRVAIGELAAGALVLLLARAALVVLRAERRRERDARRAQWAVS
jgi:hypothetical protein